MNTGKRQSRVIISATCFADADGAIAMATILAQKLNSDVYGLLVEDEAILQYANQPVANAVAFQSGIRQQVTPEAMAFAFRSDARIFKAILAKAAREASINWSFESKRGRLMPLLHSLSSKGDMVLLGYQRTPMISDEIIFLNYGNSGDSNFLELANQIAQESKVPFQAISSGKMQASERDNATINHSEDQVLELLHSKSLRAVFVAVSAEQDFDADKILEAARCPIIYLVQS